MPALPAPAVSAVAVFGNENRVRILASLARRGAATGAELQRRLGMLPNGVQPHLRVLEREGAVTADPSRVDEPGPVTRKYAIDHERVNALLDALRELTA